MFEPSPLFQPRPRKTAARNLGTIRRHFARKPLPRSNPWSARQRQPALPPPPVPLASLQRSGGAPVLLGESEALVLFAPPRGALPGIFWAVSSEGVAWAEIPLWEAELEEKIGRLRASFSGMGQRGAMVADLGSGSSGRGCDRGFALSSTRPAALRGTTRPCSPPSPQRIAAETPEEGNPPRRYNLNIDGRRSHDIQQCFQGGEVSEVAIVGEGVTDVDLEVYDEDGNLICEGKTGGDSEFGRWVPSWTGPFTIRVTNHGRAWNAVRVFAS